jgi:hypothetical protein
MSDPSPFAKTANEEVDQDELQLVNKSPISDIPGCYLAGN